MEQDAIVILRQFDDTISANIAKTKLDAYGIPCFLTHEHLANLYPGQNILSFKVALHVFSRDRQAAMTLLAESNMELNDPDQVLCLYCRSSNLEHTFPRNAGLRLTLFGIFFPEEKVYHCLDCDREF